MGLGGGGGCFRVTGLLKGLEVMGRWEKLKGVYWGSRGLGGVMKGF